MLTFFNESRKRKVLWLFATQQLFLYNYATHLSKFKYIFTSLSVEKKKVHPKVNYLENEMMKS